MSQHDELIERFMKSWSTLDIDEIMSFFAEDAVYTNIPIDPPSEGVAAIRQTIEGFVGMASEIEFVVSHQTENAQGVVMNERIDRFHLKANGNWLELPVMGVFEVADGKIKAWRDYFDMAGFSAQMGG